MKQFFTAQRVLMGSALLVFGGLAVLFSVRVYELFNRPTGPSASQSECRDWQNLFVAVPAAGFPATMDWVALVSLGETLPSAPGWEVRYNATATLARRGSPKVPLPVLCEMLDEDRQRRNFRVPLKDGRLVPNEEEALTAVLIALKAMVAWHKHPEAVQTVGKDNPQLLNLYRAVQKLTQSRNPTVRARAEETLVFIQK